MKRPDINKDGSPRKCNHLYRGYRKVGRDIVWGPFRNCQKPVGHAGLCGSVTIEKEDHVGLQ